MFVNIMETAAASRNKFCDSYLVVSVRTEDIQNMVEKNNIDLFSYLFYIYLGLKVTSLANHDSLALLPYFVATVYLLKLW